MLQHLFMLFCVLTTRAQVFVPFSFWKPQLTVTNFGTYRAWSNGSYAVSCDEYLNPKNQTIYSYAGATGNGVYRIFPLLSPLAFDVYCDMTNDGGGWMLCAIPKRATAVFSEASGLLDPTGSGSVKNSDIWSKTNSTVPFTQLRVTDGWPQTKRNIVNFGWTETFNDLFTSYATYSQNNVVASGAAITSSIGSTCFIIRGKSDTSTMPSNTSDWLFMGFHSSCATPISLGDSWDTTNPSTQWLIGASDNSDPEAGNASVGINTGFLGIFYHWENFGNTIDSKTIVWIK